MQATSFITQTMSSARTLVRVVLANPISGCQPLEHLNFTAEDYPTYYLVEGREGDCTYSLKVQVARKALARGVIIVDSAKGTNNLNARLNRYNFQIFLMDEADGALLVSSMQDKKSVIAQLSIECMYANLDDRDGMTVTLWDTMVAVLWRVELNADK